MARVVSRKRKEGISWVVDFRDLAGRRIKKTVKNGTRRDAEAMLAKVISDLNRGEFIPFSHRKRFDEVSDLYLRSKVGEVTENTLDDYRRNHRLYLRPFFGGFPIHKITRQTVEDYRARMMEKGKGVRTINKTLCLLGAIYNYAIANQWVAMNPTKGLKRLKGAQKTAQELTETRVLQPEELRRLLGTYGPEKERWKIVVETAVLTGLREGELLGLRWRDIDWKTKQIHVSRQFTKGRFAELKSRHSRRSVDISNHLVSRLRKWWGTCPKGEFNLVFPNGLGRPESHANLLQRGFYPFLRRAELRRVRFHDLRHTYASLLIANGEHPKYIQQQLGHSSVKVTMDVYGHLMQSSNPRAAEKLASLVLGSGEW